MADAVGDNKITVDVVIPCKTIDKYTLRCMAECGTQCDNMFIIDDLVCPGLPADKRNYALEQSKADVVAFIDSDAYPPPLWLDSAIRELKKGYIAVCGPGLLPPDAPVKEWLADKVLSVLPFSYRVKLARERIVRDYPTFNLVVWRKFAPRFKPLLTGEDTLFCRELSKYGKIFYSPQLYVYHNRRELFRSYIKQISTYGYYRGLIVGGLLATLIFYPWNFIRGLFRRA